LQVWPPQQTKQQGMYVEDDLELCWKGQRQVKTFSNGFCGRRKTTINNEKEANKGALASGGMELSCGQRP